MVGALNAAKTANLPHAVLEGTDAIAQKFNGTIRMPNHFIGIVDYEAGILKANKCLVAYWVILP